MQLSYELSPDDMVAAQALFWRRRRPLFFWGFTAYGVLSLLFGLWQLARGSISSAFVPLLFGVWASLYVPYIIPRSAKKSWPKTRLLHGPTTLTTTPEGVEVANPMCRAFTRWEVVGGVIEGPRVWLIFVGPLMFYVVPIRAFASDEERALFRKETLQGGTFSHTSQQAPLSAP